MLDSSIQFPPALYMAQRLPISTDHIIDHLSLELLLLYLFGYVKGTLMGACSAECVDSSII